MTTLFFKDKSILEQEAVQITESNGKKIDGISIISEGSTEILLEINELVAALEWYGYTVTEE